MTAVDDALRLLAGLPDETIAALGLLHEPDGSTHTVSRADWRAGLLDGSVEPAGFVFIVESHAAHAGEAGPELAHLPTDAPAAPATLAQARSRHAALIARGYPGGYAADEGTEAGMRFELWGMAELDAARAGADGADWADAAQEYDEAIAAGRVDPGLWLKLYRDGIHATLVALHDAALAEHALRTLTARQCADIGECARASHSGYPRRGSE